MVPDHAERVLVLGDPGAPPTAPRSTRTADASSTCTTGLPAMTLVGPDCRESARPLLRDRRPAGGRARRAFRPGSVARTPGYLLVEGEDGCSILVGWALGEYLWEVVADAAEHLGGRPVGVDALPTTRREARCVISSATGGCGAAGPSCATLRRRDHRRRRARPGRPPTTWRSSGSRTSRSSRRATSAPAPRAATRRSCAPTTRRPRAPASTTRASSSTSSFGASSTSTCSSASAAT